jgi:hypothetical protein
MEEMKWFGSDFLAVLVAINLGFGFNLAKSAKLLAGNSAKRAWHVQNQPHRALITWQHHSFDPYGGDEMVQQCFPFCAGCKQRWFWLGSG